MEFVSAMFGGARICLTIGNMSVRQTIAARADVHSCAAIVRASIKRRFADVTSASAAAVMLARKHFVGIVTERGHVMLYARNGAVLDRRLRVGVCCEKSGEVVRYCVERSDKAVRALRRRYCRRDALDSLTKRPRAHGAYSDPRTNQRHNPMRNARALAVTMLVAAVTVAVATV